MPLGQFVLKDESPSVKEMENLSGILGMNVLSELKGLFVTADGVKRTNK